MTKSKWNKLVVILYAFVLPIALPILLSSRFNTFRFNVTQLIEHLNAGNQAYINKDYATAETQYKAALKEAEKRSPENAFAVDALHHLGVTYIEANRYYDAEATFQRQVAVAEKVYGPESQDMLSPLLDLIRLCIEQRKFSEASELNRRALSIVGRGVDQKHSADAELVRTMSEEIQSKQEQNSVR